jgi:hypothetical protein
MPAHEIESLQQLYECLREATTGTPPNQRLALSGELFAAAAELLALLALSSLELSQHAGDQSEMVQLRGDHVEVKGTALLFPEGPGKLVYDVELAATFPGRPALALLGTPAGADWTFAANFAADFPDYYGAHEAGLEWLPSFLPGARFSSPTFRAATAAAPPPSGLRFDAVLDLTGGSLEPLKGFFPSDELPIGGPLIMRSGTYPLLRLTADPDYSIPQLAEMLVALGVQDEQPPPNEHPARTSIELLGTPHAAALRDVTITAGLMASPYIVALRAQTHDPEKYSLKGGLSALSGYAGHVLSLPEGFAALASMYLASITVAFIPRSEPTVSMIGFTIATDPLHKTLWSAPILGLSLEDLEVTWQVSGLSGSGPTLLGAMNGAFVLESASLAEPARLDASVSLARLNSAFVPDVRFEITLDPDTELPVKALFKAFTGLDPEVPLTITDLRLEGSTGSRTLQFLAALKPEWELEAPVSLDEIALELRYAPNSFAATLSLRVTLVGLGFIVGAAYRGEHRGWLLSGGLLPESQGTSLETVLKTIAPKYFPDKLPANLGAIELRALSSSFDTHSSEYSLNGALGWPFKFQEIELDIEAELSLTTAPDTPPAGFVRGALQIDSLTLGVKYTFGVERNNTIAFELAWRGATLTCIYARNDEDEAILSANLGGVSFGDIVAWLAAIGDEDAPLPAPWDALYRLRFDDLWLEVNLDTKAVGVRYEIDLDLAIARLTSVGLTYTRRAGAPSLEIAITGSFVGVEYTREDPLSWDLINDPPPAPPGKAEALLDLRYLGFGQNIGFRETRSLLRVEDVIDALEADFRPVEGEEDPLASLETLKFSGDGNWLIGADFTVMSAVSIAGVFADPSLYGIRVGLEGKRVKSLAGLELEILYRKITDTIGVYHIELTLPEAMRQIQIPPVALTVPTIAVDIYTNGSFKLDFGFPTGGDWERSFCLQAGPFIGFGGFYFALLDGATSEKVPAIANGTFAPVIEFGLGLQLGVGRKLDKGVLKAEATLTMQGIVEGVLAWFNPTESSVETDVYYWIQGTVSVVGKIYGAVDFVVIKASIGITLSAAVSLTLEAYAPAELQLVVAVEISASLTILFFTITFSFAATLELSFTIGEASTTPWRIAAPAERAHPLQLLAQRPSHRVRVPRAAELLRAAGPRSRAAMDWTPRRARAGEQPLDVDVRLVPTLTPALAPTTNEPAIQVVMSLLVETSTPARALHAADVRRVEHPAAPTVPFNILAGAILRWAIGALPERRDSDSVTIDELEAIASFLAERKQREATFTYARVTELIKQSFRLLISNPMEPRGGHSEARSHVPRGATAPPVQGALFPMIPELAMSAAGAPPIDFGTYNPVNDVYRAFLQSYYSQLTLAPDHDARSGERDSSDPPPPLTPIGAVVFCDWFALIAQQSVQLAAELLDAYPYRPSGEESLREIVEAFDAVTLAYRTRIGDTAATVAAAFGLTAAQLRRGNPWLEHAADAERLAPGSSIHVELRPTVRGVARANPDYSLQQGARLTIAGVRYQSHGGDTLGAIAKAFAIADLAELFVGAAFAANAENTALLRARATLAIPPAQRIVVAADLGPADALERIAATYFTRARARPLDTTAREQIAWYVAMIGELNPTFARTVSVPIATLRDGRIFDTGDRTTYTLKNGDTLVDVAATFALLQLAPKDPAWVTFRADVSVEPPPPPREGSIVRMPACSFPVRAGDTFASIAAALLVAGPSNLDPLPGALAALARANGASDVLAPRAVLALPTIELPIAAGETLGSIARRFSLTLEELADAVADDRGILAPYDGTTSFAVPDLATRKIDQLVEDLVALGSFNALSTTASRFALGGMRAPIPGPTGAPEGPMHGLYEVAGQQFPAPAATGATCSVVFTNATGATWLRFEPSPGERASGEAMEVLLTPEFFREHTPSATLDPLTVTGPVPMQLYDLAPPSYAFEHAVPWQPAAAVSLPGPSGPSGPVSGVAQTPSVWMFPPALLARLRASGPTGPTATTPPYELEARAAAPGASARPLQRYSWATAIALSVSRALDDSGAALAGVYEITGVHEAARELLLEAWIAASAAPSPRDRLYLLHRAGTAAANDAGLVSDALSATATFVLRTNLSTETHSGTLYADSSSEGLRAGTSGDYFARIAAIGPFLEEVWQATVTGTGGFHMTYADAAGQGLPDELFASDGTTELLALLLLDHQSRPVSPERGLLRFNNCAIVGEGLDAAATSLAARPRQPTAGELRRSASVPPGVVGFGLARRNPLGASGAANMTRRLHSLVGYQVSGATADFEASHESAPLGPADDAPGWLHLPPAPAHAYWSYHQVVPIAQFGRYNACPDSDALPAAAANPYAGITGPAGPLERELGHATLELAYHDVYGNTTLATHPAGEVDLAVGYTDELIGVSAWPGAALTYLFEAGLAGPRLSTSLSLQADRYIAGEGSSCEAALRAASADAERYRALFYQVQQRDVSFALGSNLGTVGADPDELRAAMSAFVTKAKLYTDAAASLSQRIARTVPREALAACAERLSVSAAMLLEANGDTDAAALFPDTYVKPHIRAAAAMNTLSALAAEVIGRSGVPVACTGSQPDPSCAARGGLLALGEAPVSARAPQPTSAASPEDVAGDNRSAPLTPGNVLRTASRTSGPIPASQRSLQELARALGCTVFAEVLDPEAAAGPALEVGLIPENWEAPSLIADGVKLSIDGVEITTEHDTFASIYARVSPPERQPRFAVGDFAVALAGVANLLSLDGTASYATLVVPQPPPPGGAAPAQPVFALADVPAAAGGIEQLALLNRHVTSFFYAGSSLLLGFSCCKAHGGDTPRSLALDAGVTLAQLADLNAATTLGAAVDLKLPEVTFLASPSSCWATFAPHAEDSLATIAEAVGASARAIADVNRALPGIFRANARVTVDGSPMPVGARDSLETAFERSGAGDWDTFVAALEQPVNIGIYRAAGAVVTPLALVPGNGEQTPPLEQLAARLHLDAGALLTANRTQHGFLRVGATVLGPPPLSTPSLTVTDAPAVVVGEFDTVLSVLRRLRALGSPATVASLLEANSGRTGILAAGARLLSAPVATQLAAPVAATVPPPGAAGEDAIVFPIEAWVEISRAPGLVHPDFLDSPAVRVSRSALAPRVGSVGESSIALRAFAEAFERAFASHPLKCAIAGDERADTRTARIWAVNFGARGISQLALDVSRPAFYALAPLSTTTWSGELRYPSYASGEGLCAEVDTRVQSVDVDAWMRELLATIDLALTPGYAVPAFRMGASAHAGPPTEEPRHPLDALSTPTPAPVEPDPLSGPIGLVSAARLTRPSLASLAVGASGCSGPTANGPADYERLVGAKEHIAQALRERVAPIVQAPGASGPYQLEWAAEALYQQMLVRLSDGYDVSAIVQLPCEVSSPLVTPPPGMSGPAPPRTSGKVVPVLHTVPSQAPRDGGATLTDVAATPSVAGAPGSLESLAGTYGVSPAFLAQVIGGLEGLLLADAEIAGVTVGPYGTINKVAADVGLPTDPQWPGYWDLWVPFVDGFAAREVLQKGAAVPLTALARTVAGGESLTAVGEFFGRDAGSVGRANQARAGIVRAGPIVVAGYPEPYTATSADTFVSIADGISAANPGLPRLTTAMLFQAVAEWTAFLEPEASLRMIEPLPGMSISTAKVSLGPVGKPSGPPPPLTFLVSVKQEAEQARLLLNLDYTINELEYRIRDVAAAGSYQASSWLTFLLPLDGSGGGAVDARTAIPQIQVPIPLRAYPQAPVLSEHSGTARDAGSAIPARAREWDYRFDVRTRQAAQDTEHLRVLFGERGRALSTGAATLTLMRWLGAYVAAAPTLVDDLARLPKLAPGAYDAHAAHAVQALSIIAERVAGALSADGLFAAMGASAAHTYNYRLTTLTDGGELATMRLTPEPPGPSGPLPRVYVKSPTAATGATGADAGYLELERTGEVYHYPGGFYANDQQTYRFRFDGRDVIRDCSGRGAIAVTRNDRLIARGPLGPTGSPAPVPTSEGFIYRTLYTQFVDPLIPLIEADAPIDVAALEPGPEPRPLERHIVNVVRAATDVDSGASAEPADIELAVAFAFPVAGGLNVTTPICLVPCRRVSGDDVATFARALAQTLARWHRDTPLDEQGSLLAFELCVFAYDTAPSYETGESIRRPILRFTDLRLHLQDITWPPVEEHQQ